MSNKEQRFSGNLFSVHVNSQLSSVVVFEVEGVGMVTPIVSLCVHYSQYYALGNLTQKDVFRVKTAKSSWNREHFTVDSANGVLGAGVF